MIQGDVGGEGSVKIFDRIKKFFNSTNDGNSVPVTQNKTYLMSEIIDLFSGKGSDREYGQDLGEVTYLTCLKVISEAVGKIPVYLIDENKKRVKDNEIVYLLTVRPNPYQTPSQFFIYLEFCRNHRGNAFCYINRLANGKVEGLYPLDPNSVQLWVNNTNNFTNRTFYYHYIDSKNGKEYWLQDVASDANFSRVTSIYEWAAPANRSGVYVRPYFLLYRKTLEAILLSPTYV